MGQEGVNSSDGPLLCGQRSAVNLRDSELSRKFRNKIAGQSAGPKHLPHRTRRRRVVVANHDGGGRASVGRQRHWIPRGLCLGG